MVRDEGDEIGERKGAFASYIEHAAGEVGPIKRAANRRHHVLRGRGMNKLSGRTVRPHSPPGDLRIEGTRCWSSGTVRASGPQNDPRHRVAQGVAQSTLPIEFRLFVRCGKVKFEVITNLEQVIACNCSICQKTGTMLTFVPSANFNLISGADSLTDYQFNKKIIHHLFCKTCGVRSFARGKGADGSEMIAINVHCLDDVNRSTLSSTPFDGKSL